MSAAAIVAVLPLIVLSIVDKVPGSLLAAAEDAAAAPGGIRETSVSSSVNDAVPMGIQMPPPSPMPAPSIRHDAGSQLLANQSRRKTTWTIDSRHRICGVAMPPPLPPA